MTDFQWFMNSTPGVFFQISVEVTLAGGAIILHELNRLQYASTTSGPTSGILSRTELKGADIDKFCPRVDSGK